MSRRIMIDQIAFDEAVDKICKIMTKLDERHGISEAIIKAHVDGIISITTCMRLELFDTANSLTANTKQGGQNYE